jgi:hypothetical protein
MPTNPVTSHSGPWPRLRHAPGRRPARAPHPRKAAKTARFLDLVTERHGPLASVPLDRVAGISATRGRSAPNGGYRCLCGLGRLNHGLAIWCRIGHQEGRPDRTQAHQDVVAMG